MRYFNADFDPFFISFYVRIVFEIKFQRASEFFHGSVFIAVADKKFKFSTISGVIYRMIGSNYISIFTGFLIFGTLLGKLAQTTWLTYRDTSEDARRKCTKKTFFLLSYLSKNIPGSRTYYTSIHTFLVTSSTTKICKAKENRVNARQKYQIVFHTLLFDASCQSNVTPITKKQIFEILCFTEEPQNDFSVKNDYSLNCKVHVWI